LFPRAKKLRFEAMVGRDSRVQEVSTGTGKQSANDDQSAVRRPEQTLEPRANPTDVFKSRGELWPAIQGVGAAPAARRAMRRLIPVFPQHLGRCATTRLARLGPEPRRVPLDEACAEPRDEFVPLDGRHAPDGRRGLNG
jgi:hypothetical protein